MTPAGMSMRPGITFQVYQPGAAQVPGLDIFGEDAHLVARPSREEYLAVVSTLRLRPESPGLRQLLLHDRGHRQRQKGTKGDVDTRP